MRPRFRAIAPADPSELPDEVPQAELATEENGEIVVEDVEA